MRRKVEEERKEKIEKIKQHLRYLQESGQCAMCFNEIPTQTSVKFLCPDERLCSKEHNVCAKCGETLVRFARTQRIQRANLSEIENAKRAGDEGQCPICISMSKVDGVALGTAIATFKSTHIQTTTKRQIPPCSFECGGQVTRECTTCKMAICEKEACLQQTKVLHKNFLKHELVIEELKTTKEFAEMCVEHQRRFDMFCEEGNVPVCSQCIIIGKHHLKDGTTHKRKTVEEATKMMKETLERDSEELKRKREKAQEAMEMNGKNKEELESEFQKRKEDIDRCFEEIEITMKRRHETLIEQIQAIHDMKCLFSLFFLFLLLQNNNNSGRIERTRRSTSIIS